MTAFAPEPDDDGEDEEDEDLPQAELAEKAAEMSVCGYSPRKIAREMGLESQADAQRLIDMGKLAASRRSAEDVRADHLVLTRKVLREAAATARKPGPLLDRTGNPVLDDEGMAYPDLEMRDRAHQTMGKYMEREAKLTGADAPARSVSASMTLDPAALREYLLSSGMPAELVNMPLDRILALTAAPEERA